MLGGQGGGDRAETKLTPAAASNCKIAASNKLQDKRIEPGQTGVPCVAFTNPELTRIGLLQKVARKTGDVEISVTDTAGWFSQRRWGNIKPAR